MPRDGDVDRLISALKAQGFRISFRQRVKGLSGICFFFEVLAEDPESGAKVAITATERISLADVINILACRIDLGVQHVIIAESADPQAVKILEGLGILVIVKGALSRTVYSSMERKYGVVVEKIIGAIVRVCANSV